MTEKEKMLSGALYNGSDEELVKERLHAQTLCAQYNKTMPADGEERARILRTLLGKGGDTAYIEPTFRCDYGYNISVGKNFYANYDCIFLDIAPIQIGDNCFFAPRVCLYTAGHPLDYPTRNSLEEFGKPITIGNNVWFGGNVVVCPGVTVGNGVVAAAGAVIAKDVPDNVLVGGNPARIIRQIENGGSPV